MGKKTRNSQHHLQHRGQHWRCAKTLIEAGAWTYIYIYIYKTRRHAHTYNNIYSAYIDRAVAVYLYVMIILYIHIPCRTTSWKTWTEKILFWASNPVLIRFDWLFPRTAFYGFLRDAHGFSREIYGFWTGWQNQISGKPGFGAISLFFCSGWAQKPGLGPTSQLFPGSGGTWYDY